LSWSPPIVSNIMLGRVSYPPVGTCIYCGSRGGHEGLRDEHIVPYFLGGNAVLQAASCKRCEGATSYIEGYAARRIFHLIRGYYRLQKRKRKEATPTVEVVIRSSSGKRTAPVEVGIAPGLLVLPTLPPPGIVLDRPPRGLIPLSLWHWYSPDFQARMSRLYRPGEYQASIQSTIKVDIFGRVLAKIAHTISVASFGLDGFRPFLPPIILGTDPHVGHFVGQSREPTQAGPLPQPGVSKLEAHEMTIGVGRTQTGQNYLTATIRLFTFTGSPTYFIVVGTPTQRTLEQLAVPAHDAKP
jgi:hypothetical protein